MFCFQFFKVYDKLETNYDIDKTFWKLLFNRNRLFVHIGEVRLRAEVKNEDTPEETKQTSQAATTNSPALNDEKIKKIQNLYNKLLRVSFLCV